MRRRSSATGSRSSARAWSAVASRGCSPRFPGVEVTLVDVDAGRAEIAAALGVDFALPADAAGGRDLVVHTSATVGRAPASLDLLGAEGTVLELSWYGDRDVTLSLGRRVPLRPAGHPGQPGRRRRAGPAREPHDADRLALALDLLRDPAFDALLTGASRFDELPDVMARLAAGAPAGAAATTITYARRG